MQVPTATSVTVLPDTVQMPVVVEVKATASEDVAVALTVKGGELSGFVESAPKAIKEGISKADAEKLKKQLEEAGATVEIK